MNHPASWSVGTTEEVDVKSGQVAWECSRDLCGFLGRTILDSTSRLSKILSSSDDQINILELGCGVGDPLCSVITTLSDRGYSGTTNIVFQDYNTETIESVTKPNVEARFAELSLEARNRIRISWLAGSWETLSLDEFPKFDLILSSECVYREDLFESFSSVVDNALSPNGVCYVAAKRYYFGCGGGTIEYSDYLSHTPLYSSWHVEVAHIEENGASNTREILEIFR